MWKKNHMNNERKAIIYSKVRQGKRIKSAFFNGMIMFHIKLKYYNDHNSY